MTNRSEERQPVTGAYFLIGGRWVLESELTVAERAQLAAEDQSFEIGYRGLV